MLSFLPLPLRSFLSFLMFALNTALWCTVTYFFAAIKLLLPIQRLQSWCTKTMIHIGETWISGNQLDISLFHKIEWDIQGLEHLRPDRSYLVCANHQSWVDIVILQQIFNHRIPFLRFFLKQQLIYVPFLGAAWWALDFPFMKRYSKSYLDQHPEKRGADLAATRRACERFKGSQISILNFLEGTRFTKAKHALQQSPYQNLLKPKTGGLAFVLDAMGTQFDSLLDVTIIYPNGPVSMMQMFGGQLQKVSVKIRQVEIPKELTRGQYLENESFRKQMQEWVQQIWQQKDKMMSDFANATKNTTVSLPNHEK